MTNETKAKRLNVAIKETEDKIAQAVKKLSDSRKCYEIEVAENIELGNDETANELAAAHVEEREERLEQLRAHKLKLENMLRKVVA